MLYLQSLARVPLRALETADSSTASVVEAVARSLSRKSGAHTIQARLRTLGAQGASCGALCAGRGVLSECGGA